MITLCLSHIEKGAKLGRALPPNVNHPCDFYTILAGHMLLEQYQLSCEQVAIMEEEEVGRALGIGRDCPDRYNHFDLRLF